ncbi:MAG: helix-turn-helix domain-containing protein [Bacteroidota bacterium]
MLVQQIGSVIKARRKALGLTQPHLAELAEISTNTLYKIERGQTNPTLEILEKIFEVLGLELSVTVKQLN